MIELANDKKKQDEYAEESLKYIKNFHIATIVNQWEILLKYVVKNEKL